jgi:hypothetical protein
MAIDDEPCLPSGVDVTMGVVEAGHDDCATEVDDLGAAIMRFRTSRGR